MSEPSSWVDDVLGDVAILCSNELRAELGAEGDGLDVLRSDELPSLRDKESDDKFDASRLDGLDGLDDLGDLGDLDDLDDLDKLWLGLGLVDLINDVEGLCLGELPKISLLIRSKCGE